MLSQYNTEARETKRVRKMYVSAAIPVG